MILLMLSTALSQAATAAPGVSQVPVEVVAPTQPRRICRIERDTGSRVQARRICQTSAERDQERDAAQRSAQEGVDRQWERDWGDRIGQVEQRGGLSPGMTSGITSRGPR